MAIKTAKELAAMCKDVAQNYKTLYVMGCFGAPMNAKNKERYSANNSYNRQTERSVMIKNATSKTFGFDCVCFIKGLLWDWNGDTSKTYGGATYKSNGVPDINADQMIEACDDVSTDFTNIQVGEVVWMEGHIGVYIGGGLAVECTPKWTNGVQITAVHNIGTKIGYNGRKWTKHGKLPYLTYDKPNNNTSASRVGSTVNIEMTVLKKGAKGDEVKALQALLIGYGYSCGDSGVDGSFGGATDRAVRAFQKDRGLEVDGSVGPATWTNLLGV